MDIVSIFAILKPFVGFMGLAMSLAYFPQAYVLYKRKTSRDLSLVSYFVFGIGALAYTIYGFLLGNLALTASSLLGTIGASLVITLAFRYRKNS